MCGRFSITGDLDFYAEYFGADRVDTDQIAPSWNVAPTDIVYVIAERDGDRSLGSMGWGLVPHWAQDTKTRHINARSETIATTAAFRTSFSKRRCLIPADGFYEWESPENGRTPHWVYRADGFPMSFAGIWSTRYDDATSEWQRTCAIITGEAEGVIADIHTRMPLAVPPEAWDVWLDRDMTDSEAALSIITKPDGAEMMEHIVSKAVNSVRNNNPDLRTRIEPETLF